MADLLEVLKLKPDPSSERSALDLSSISSRSPPERIHHVRTADGGRGSYSAHLDPA